MRALSLTVLAALMSLPAAAEKSPSTGGNAALRYWMAFALMENPPAEGAVAKKVASTADGQGVWDESLAPIVERNEEALTTMHRGSRLGWCDWGYDYELLAESPVANLPRARALARLNVLHGLRLMAQDRTAEAVEVWLAGVRFSRDIAADGPWLSALIAAPSLKAHLQALSQAVQQNKVDAAGRARIEKEIGVLPDAGFDWSIAARHESEGTSALTAVMEKAPDPVARLATYFPSEGKDPASHRAELARVLGLDPAKLSDTEAVRAVFRRTRAHNDQIRPSLIAAFAARWDAASPAFESIDARASQDALLSHVWSKAARHNQVRGEVVKARAELLSLVRAR